MCCGSHLGIHRLSRLMPAASRHLCCSWSFPSDKRWLIESAMAQERFKSSDCQQIRVKSGQINGHHDILQHVWRAFKQKILKA